MARFTPNDLTMIALLESESPFDRRFEALREIYGRALKAFNDNHRVQNAVLLILNGHVTAIETPVNGSPEDDVYKIRGQSGSNIYYTVKRTGCNCVDGKNTVTNGFCKHRICRGLIIRTRQLLDQWKKEDSASKSYTKKP
jgi:hypothetical protein